MKVIDLTHVIAADMPVYPGTEPPRLESANTYEANGFKETLLTMSSHTGTHMDPPAHLFPGRTTLDQFPSASSWDGRWSSGIAVPTGSGARRSRQDMLIPPSGKAC